MKFDFNKTFNEQVISNSDDIDQWLSSNIERLGLKAYEKEIKSIFSGMQSIFHQQTVQVLDKYHRELMEFIARDIE